MERRPFNATDVNTAREEIFQYIQLFKDRKVIYFDGWNGFGAAPVLRSIAQVLPSIEMKKSWPDLCYDRIIYIDCSAWISERVMQKRIAEELGLLDHGTLALFDKHDEEDDFNGVDRSHRDVIRRVSQVIGQTLVSSSLIMVFLNGSDHEVDISKFGISPNYLDHVVVWTFRRRLLTMHDRGTSGGIANKLRYTQLFVESDSGVDELTASQFTALLREEADIMLDRNRCMHMQDINSNMVANCCLYYLFLYYCFHGSDEIDLLAQAPNCWLCDGDIKSDISNALHAEIKWECDTSLLQYVFKKFIKDPDSPFLIVSGDNAYTRRPYNWISVSITSNNLTVWEDMQTVLPMASSFFATSENSMVQQRLPDRFFEFFATSENSMVQQRLPDTFFEQCNNLRVLNLCWCTFSFLSPPFLKCQTLRFLGLDRCTDNKANNVDESTEWAFLHKLWVLEMHYTHWNEIITEEKMDVMANLQELNIEGFCCWQYTRKLQGRLPDLQRLRIIKPTQQAGVSLDSRNSFMDKTRMEILDLSGNSDMKNLPASLSKASNLQILILDGCHGIENVVVPNGLPSSLRLFSLDGYGPVAPHWISTMELPLESFRPKCAPDTTSMDSIVKISKISLKGCTKLTNLFVRGLPNLEELDLSGTAIKKLDFKTMVLDVPKLKQLFLLGCEYLRVIICDSHASMRLDLICLDTRAGTSSIFTRPCRAQHKESLHLHAILGDARLARSLCSLLESNYNNEEDVHFNIHITSSTEDATIAIEPEATIKEMTELSIRQHHGCLANQYDGVLTKLDDAKMLAFPDPPTQRLHRHIEISDGSFSLETELASSSNKSLASLLQWFTQSLHVHDIMIGASLLAEGEWYSLKWFRVERCPNLDTIFGEVGFNDVLEIIWVSDLLMARSLWTEVYSFENLKHLHLRCCPRLHVSPMFDFDTDASFPNLETIHIIQCGDLQHVIVPGIGMDPEKIAIRGIWFPKLTTIHLHDLPKLQQISEVKMFAPALETIRIRGCWSLRRLPAVAVREPGQRRPTVEIEKDVWDALQWDRKIEKGQDMSVVVGHHPGLFEPPVHCRYFKKRHLRGTVLR